MPLDILSIPQDELEQIEKNYAMGRYALLEEAISKFLKMHSGKIFDFKKELEQKHKRTFSLDEAVRLYIAENKTVNFRLDMQDQKEEIMREKWIRHERNPHEPAEKIKAEWVRSYAWPWRIHRVREIIYLFERRKEEYLKGIT